MSSPKLFSTTPSAAEWLRLNQIHMPRDANEVAGKSLSILTGAAVMPVLVMAHFTTNPVIDYAVQFDHGHTNPSIAMRDETLAGWLQIEETDEDTLQQFVAFMDEQISNRPDLVEPVDMVQLDRLSKLLANVQV